MNNTNVKYIQCCIWSGLFSAVLVTAVFVFFGMQFRASGEGKHVWVTDGDSPNIETMVQRLSRYEWRDISPKNLDEFAEQLNTFVPTGLHQDADSQKDFKKVFESIEPNERLDRGLLRLLNELELDIAASDGALMIGPRSDNAVLLIRVYDLPDVSIFELRHNIEDSIDPYYWRNAGGNSSMELQRSEMCSRIKLVVSAPYHTHRRIEQFFEVLAQTYGWKTYQLPPWIVSRKAASTPTPAPGPLGLGGGGMGTMGSGTMGSAPF